MSKRTASRQLALRSSVLLILLLLDVDAGQVGGVDRCVLVALVLRLLLHVHVIAAVLTVTTTTLTRPRTGTLAALAVTRPGPFAVTGPRPLFAVTRARTLFAVTRLGA